MNHPLLELVREQVDAEFHQPTPRWNPATMTAKEWTELEKECQVASEFDPLNTRRDLFREARENPSQILTKECVYGRVTVFLPKGISAVAVQNLWPLWGRVLRMYSAKGPTPFRIYLFAIDRPRRFPNTANEPISPLHINGGYTYPCKKNMIIIYRLEDATRVLIHELQHACCLDDHTQGVDAVEAETEAWAELWYVAMLSRGQLRAFRRGIQMQSDWIHAQNKQVRRWIGTTHRFPWRYTIGKEDVWQRWGILLPAMNTPMEAQLSLRLTYRDV